MLYRLEGYAKENAMTGLKAVGRRALCDTSSRLALGAAVHAIRKSGCILRSHKVQLVGLTAMKMTCSFPT